MVTVETTLSNECHISTSPGMKLMKIEHRLPGANIWLAVH